MQIWNLAESFAVSLIVITIFQSIKRT